MKEKPFNWSLVLAPVYVLLGAAYLFLGREKRAYTGVGLCWLLLAAGHACVAVRDLRDAREE